MPKKGYKPTEEAKLNMGKSHIGAIPSDETKRKISETEKGKIVSEETKRKISRANKGKPSGRLGKHLSKEVKWKISESLKGKPSKLLGRHLSEKAKKKISNALKGNHLSEKTKQKISESLKGKYVGDKHWNWQGGIGNDSYPTNWTDDLREAIRKRDNYICQSCGIHQDELKGWTKKLDIHHIDYDKDNLDPKNLITLCRRCHIKTNHNREYWIEYFRELRESSLEIK